MKSRKTAVKKILAGIGFAAYGITSGYGNAFFYEAFYSQAITGKDYRPFLIASLYMLSAMFAGLGITQIYEGIKLYIKKMNTRTEK